VFRFHAHDRAAFKQALDALWDETHAEKDTWLFKMVHQFKEQDMFQYKSCFGQSPDVVGVSLSVNEDNRMVQQ
jgi:hypothetical protein